MNYLSSFFMAFCVSAIFIGAVFIICPSGQIKKSVQYILSLVFTLIIVSSALKIDLDLDFNTDTVDVQTNAQAIEETTAVYVYGQCLESAGIDFSKISVLTNKNSDGSIVISKVLIFSKEEDGKILSALSAVAQNFEVEIINE